jgi:hypothetical protein
MSVVCPEIFKVRRRGKSIHRTILRISIISGQALMSKQDILVFSFRCQEPNVVPVPSIYRLVGNGAYYCVLIVTQNLQNTHITWV